MPKCFLFTIRGYRDGKYRGCTADCHNVNVMTTRSGLIIDTRRVLSLFHSRNDSQQLRIVQDKVRHKSCRRAPDANNLSIVTRYLLFLSAQPTDEEDDFAEETSEANYLELMSQVTVSKSSTASLLVKSSQQPKVSKSAVDILRLLNKALPCPLVSGSRHSLQPSATCQADEIFKKPLSIKYVTTSNQFTTPNITIGCMSSSWKKSGTYLDGLHGYCRDLGAEAAGAGGSSGGGASSQASLLHHVSHAHRCAACGRIFTVLAAYHTHVATHLKQNSRCAICHKEFKRSWLLKGHMRTHTGERPFKCVFPGCDRAFADKSNLRSHSLIHQCTSKTFACERCGRAFAQKRYLHKHRLEVCKL